MLMIPNYISEPEMLLRSLLVPGGFEGLDGMKEVEELSKQEGLTIRPETICFLWKHHLVTVGRVAIALQGQVHHLVFLIAFS